MNTFKKQQMLLLFFLLPLQFVHAKFTFESDRWQFNISGFYKPESFFAENFSTFNKKDKADRVFFVRGTADINLDFRYGLETFKDDTVLGRLTFRNKALWGNPSNIVPTSSATIKTLEAVLGDHSHGIPRHLWWTREIWFSVDLADVFDIPFCNKQIFKLGAFPYQLGRGITLGDAYAVGPDVLGFYSESSTIDQFAYAALYSSELVKDTLTAELYAALLQNKSGSLSDTNAKIFGQEYGRFATPKREFGSINYVITGKLLWQALNDAWCGNLRVEPYFLFNSEPEQFIEFNADSSSKLGSIGMAAEYSVADFEFGFDWAVNMGKQKVKGWDRNQIILQNRSGVVTLVNDKVFVGDPNDPEAQAQQMVYVPNSTNQKVVYDVFQAASQNGKMIGVTAPDENGNSESIFNANNRFRDSYNNVYKGCMAVADAAYWFADHTVRLAGMAGFATGDENPNAVVKDGDYTGFITLQEIYSGDRVRSAFFLGGQGKAKRPLSKAGDLQAPDKFQREAALVSGFTNVILVGGSALWAPKDFCKPFKINPNIMAFWQEHGIGNIRTFYGVETNIFMNCNLLENLEIFFIGSVFIPGGHYTDRKDVPALSIEQDDVADETDVTGFEADRIPGLGDNVAFTLNAGFKLTF